MFVVGTAGHVDHGKSTLMEETTTLLYIVDQIFGMRNYPFWAMLFNPTLVALAGVAPAGAISMVWAPFGALICALVAWRKGLNWRRCAIAGAVCSALFFLPWAYLVTRMLGWAIPKPLVAIPYVVLYAAWLRGPFQLSYDAWADGDDLYPSALWLCMWLGNASAIIASMLLMTPIAKRINPLRRANRDGVPIWDTLPNPVYLFPFALFSGDGQRFLSRC